MADQSLIDGILTISEGGINRTILPENFSIPYARYVLSSDVNLASVGKRANAAAQGAYDAQVKNDVQDIRLDGHDADIFNLDNRLIFVEGDYVSKSAATLQSIASPLSVATSYSVNGTKVVGERVTGITPAAGTAFTGAFNANSGYPVGATYSQSEVLAIAAGLVEARQRIKTLEDALRTHGLIA
ncbi:phage tail protein [Serratia sp. UGAL515B_01]|uniref:phage tail protein n=1 Tax=Serratia sp. UGAL515B_01 TaxID=2986763 RepID=UPI0029546D02|nr:phage tail protein [Serratia sp. UGAL515B_01]WON77581.1 phage tail protein [Serratia sp. UGAL515B_01]